MIHSFIGSLNHRLSDSHCALNHWFIDSLMHLFIGSLNHHWVIHSLNRCMSIHWFHWFIAIDPLSQLFIDSWVHQLRSFLIIVWLIYWPNNSLIFGFAESSVHWRIDSLIHWFIDSSFFRWLTAALVYWFINSSTHALLHWFSESSMICLTIDSLNHWFFDSLNHSLTTSSHSLMQWLTGSLVYSVSSAWILFKSFHLHFS